MGRGSRDKGKGFAPHLPLRPLAPLPLGPLTFETLEETLDGGVGEVGGPGNRFTGNMPLIGVDSKS